MLIDFRAVPADTRIEADVCVIGAGAAGITLALELHASNLEVCLLESGGVQFSPETQDLARGVSFQVGWPYQKLEATRIRTFGGTTTVWDGACVPCTGIDFEKRDWVPHSGWPITRASLDPYYTRAEAVCELGAGEYGAELWGRFGQPSDAFDRDKLDVRFWRYSPTRFGARYGDEIRRSKNIRLYLFANVTHLRANEAGSAIDEIEVETLDGNRGTVAARAYVLATGGIENARLLLNASDVEPAGLGNRHDLVGRYFMEHSYYQSGFLVSEDLERLMQRYDHMQRGPLHVLAGVRLADSVQRRERTLDCCSLLDDRFHRDNPGVIATRRILQDIRYGQMSPELGNKIYDILSNLDAVLMAGIGAAVHGDSRHYEEKGVPVFTQAEQAPNPSNRVFLEPERDPLGLQRVSLDWRLGELDRRTIEVAVKQVGSEFARLGLGRVRIADWTLEADDSGWRSGLHWGHHHMGTTRMSDDPKTGVVNADCRMHSVHNLYVASSSVFPTGGYANPTLTIVALAIRLADHLRSELASRAVDLSGSDRGSAGALRG
ncbi:MAG: GMC oxidoreductase [Myxococcota bacterium]